MIKIAINLLTTNALATLMEKLLCIDGRASCYIYILQVMETVQFSFS